MALTHGDLGPVTIQKARVIDVDTRYYTLGVATAYTKKPLMGVPFATPYQHFANGEGIYFMPEVGSVCWLCEPSDGSMPFVLAWGSTQEESDYRAMKMSLNPGDIYLGTRDENCIILRRGGIVQLSATPLCQRLFLPINNTINDFCENYGLHTLGGDLEWAVSITPETKDGKRPARLLLKAKEFANDPNPVAELEIGSHGEGSDSILSLIVRESGAKGAATKISLSLDKTGNVMWKVAQDVSWSVDGQFDLTVKKDLTLHSDTNATLEGQLQANVRGGAVNVVSTSGAVAVQAAAGMVVTSPMKPAFMSGAGTNPAMMASPSVIAWLMSHAHLSSTPGQPTSPPIAPFPVSDAVSLDILLS